jgi:hypothetical protein
MIKALLIVSIYVALVLSLSHFGKMSFTGNEDKILGKAQKQASR